MTQQEMVTASNYVRCEDVITALITIKRGIYSKPIKAYINSLLSKMAVHERCYKSAMSYRLVQESFTYGQKTPCKIDVEV